MDPQLARTDTDDLHVLCLCLMRTNKLEVFVPRCCCSDEIFTKFTSKYYQLDRDPNQDGFLPKILQTESTQQNVRIVLVIVQVYFSFKSEIGFLPSRFLLFICHSDLMYKWCFQYPNSENCPYHPSDAVEELQVQKQTSQPGQKWKSTAIKVYTGTWQQEASCSQKALWHTKLKSASIHQQSANLWTGSVCVKPQFVSKVEETFLSWMQDERKHHPIWS